MNVAIVDATERHALRIARFLDPSVLAFAAAAGIDPRRKMIAAVRSSLYARTMLVDGVPAALGGIAAPLASPSAFLWLAVTERARGYPFALGRALVREFRLAQRWRARFTAVIDPTDFRACRFARAVGFEIGAAVELPNGRRLCDAVWERD